MSKLKNNEGFTQIDIIVSIVIIMLFATLIASLFYNAYSSSVVNKRNTEAAVYLTQIFETIDLIDYDKLEDLNDGIVAKINKMDENKIYAQYVENISSQNSLSTPYKIYVEVEDLQNSNNNNNINANQDDLIKIITITIKYNINKKEQVLSAKRIKTRQFPYQDSLEIMPYLLDGMTPLDNQDNMQITTVYSSNWFEYSNEKPAQTTLQDVLSMDDLSGKIVTLGSQFVYIPRFAYSYFIDENGNKNTKIKFVDTDNTCKDGSSTKIYYETQNLEENKYYIPKAFTQENIELEGIWVGKYLCKKNTDGINENIHVTSAEENPQIWTGLTENEKQQKITQMTDDNNNYGLTQDTTIKIVENSINDLIEKLKTSNFSFISNQIQENEKDYTGSFRIYMY